MKYLVWGYYGFGNLGDEMMLDAMVKKIREKDPESTIFVRCFDKPYTKRPITPVNLAKDEFMAKKYYYLSVPFLILRIALLISNIDALVIGGGTLFVDKGRHNKSLLVLAIAVFLSKIFKKKIYVTGVGIDKLSNPLSIRYTNYILGKSDYICVRDEFSYSYVRESVKGKFTLLKGADLLFSASPADTFAPAPQKNGNAVLFSVKDYFNALQNSSADGETFATRLAEIAEFFLKNKKRVIFISFQRGMGGYDYEYGLMLKEKYLAKYGQEVSVIHVKDADQLAGLFGNASLVIGMRFHALVLASLFERPFIGISHENKIKELCDAFHLPWMPIETLLLKKTDAAGLCKNATKVDRSVLSSEIKSAELNFNFLNGK